MDNTLLLLVLAIPVIVSVLSIICLNRILRKKRTSLLLFIIGFIFLPLGLIYGWFFLWGLIMIYLSLIFKILKELKSRKEEGKRKEAWLMRFLLLIITILGIPIIIFFSFSILMR